MYLYLYLLVLYLYLHKTLFMICFIILFMLYFFIAYTNVHIHVHTHARRHCCYFSDCCYFTIRTFPSIELSNMHVVLHIIYCNNPIILWLYIYMSILVISLSSILIIDYILNYPYGACKHYTYYINVTMLCNGVGNQATQLKKSFHTGFYSQHSSLPEASTTTGFSTKA